MPQSRAPVLLVDSNRDGLELYATALALAGIESTTADSAREAIQRVATNPPRVLVTGMRLRGTSATELIQRARRQAHDDIFIVALTTNAQFETRPAQEAGCDVVLPLPCLPETLVDELRRVL